MIVKVCGMTRPEDVEFCDGLGIDLLGFIFHAPSPRGVAPGWVATQKPRRSLKTGVFVRQGVDEIGNIAREAGLDLLQLHGGHTPEQCRALGPERVIKVLWPKRYATAELLLADMELFAPVCRAILLGQRHQRRRPRHKPECHRSATTQMPPSLVSGRGPRAAQPDRHEIHRRKRL
jgi:Phosphoribosylanthranilate isomerase